MALLPMTENRCAVVCTVNNPDTATVMALDDTRFMSLLQERFGDRLGPFLRVGRRQAYPLFLLKAREHARQRVAIIGNAAHTLHPIAGQGFNLGIRDVAALAEVVAEGVPAHQQAHRVFPGNRPSTTVLAPQLTPGVLGQLIALYEQIVFVQGVVWGVNSFDQWGVELGKALANRITPELSGTDEPQHDTSTNSLIAWYRSNRVG